MIVAATLLDPRFEKVAFADRSAAEQAIRRLKGEVAELHDVTQQCEVNDVQAQQSEISQATDGLWSFFDEKVAEASSRRTTETDSFIEVTRYFEEKNIDRKENPLQWWRYNGARFPNLMVLAQKYLAIPGSSVPSERLFSKAGELISERRSKLKPKNIDMLLFLNKNL